MNGITQIGFTCSALQMMFRSLVKSRTLQAPSRQCHTDRPVQKVTQCLAEEFESLRPNVIANIIRAYNHVLPTFHAERDTIKDVKDKTLYKLFEHMDFYEREKLIDKIVSLAKLQKVSAPPKPKENKAEPPELPVMRYLHKLKAKDTASYYKQKTIHAMNFGSPLIIDCDYEELMAGRALYSYVHQITALIHANYLASNPFALHLCNLSESSALFGSDNPTVMDLDQEMVVTNTGCFTQLFDTRDLVVLSPDAPLYMEEYNPQKVYVIGGLVDLADDPPATASKAEALGIECRSLPLDVFMTWEGGQNKRLTLPSVYKLLEHLSRHRDWASAINYALPSRLLGGSGKEKRADG